MAMLIRGERTDGSSAAGMRVQLGSSLHSWAVKLNRPTHRALRTQGNLAIVSGSGTTCSSTPSRDLREIGISTKAARVSEFARFQWPFVHTGNIVVSDTL